MPRGRCRRSASRPRRRRRPAWRQRRGSAASVVVTAINDSTGEESLPSADAGASSATAGAWSWTAVTAAPTTTSTRRRARCSASWRRCRKRSGPTPISIPTSPPRRRAAATRSATASSPASDRAGGSGYTSPTGELIDKGARSRRSLRRRGGAIASATPAATGQSVSANAYVQISDGEGSDAVLTPVWRRPDRDRRPAPHRRHRAAGGSGYSGHVSVIMTITWRLDSRK